MPVPTLQWVPAGAIGPITGSPTLGTALGTVPAWVLDPTTTEGVGVAFSAFPTNWATYDVDIWWSHPTTDTGDVVWTILPFVLTEGSPTNAGAAGAMTTTSTAPAQRDLAIATVTTSPIPVPAAGNGHSLRIQRLGGDAADTFPSDAQLIGVMLKKAS